MPCTDCIYHTKENPCNNCIKVYKEVMLDVLSDLELLARFEGHDLSFKERTHIDTNFPRMAKDMAKKIKGVL